MLLRRLGRPFRVVRSTYRESFRRGEPPSAAAMRNAAGKAAAAVLPRGGAPGIVLGADTFLYFRGRLIGKPSSMREARRMLRALAGRSHWVYTGLCLIDTAARRRRVSYARTRVSFRPLSDAQIARLLPRMRPLDKAGAYALQEDEGELVARIEGSRTNVVGLPLALLRRELAGLGIDIWSACCSMPTKDVTRLFDNRAGQAITPVSGHRGFCLPRNRRTGLHVASR